MATIVENEKGFKVIEVTGHECRVKIYGGLGLCDSCCDGFDKAYYIAVLHCCYCPTCYKIWMVRAVYYNEDKAFENRAFERMKIIMGIN